METEGSDTIMSAVVFSTRPQYPFPFEPATTPFVQLDFVSMRRGMILIFTPNVIPLRRTQPDAITEVAEKESAVIVSLQVLESELLQSSVDCPHSKALPSIIRPAAIHRDGQHQR